MRITVSEFMSIIDRHKHYDQSALVDRLKNDLNTVNMMKAKRTTALLQIIDAETLEQAKGIAREAMK